MEQLKGKDVVAKINKEIKEQLESLNGYIPHLAIIRVGENPDDLSYEKGATKRVETIGLNSTSFVYPKDISNEAFIKAFQSINENPDIDGILLLRPLPKHIDEKYIETIIDPSKDIDGISPINMAKIFTGDDSGFAPCTAQAVIEMLDYLGEPLSGKRVTLIGRSLVVGKPLAMLLIKKNTTVTVCHTRTVDLEGTCRNAEILIAAAGSPKMVNKSHVSEGTIVIDVGINVDENGKLCGDVDFEDIVDVARIATPVPGGVGTVTTSVLAKQLVRAASHRKH